MRYIEFDQVDSTNDYIKRNLDYLDNFCVVRSDLQTNGRGRNGHTWQSKANQDLLMSILVKNFKDPRDIHKMTQIAACCVVSVLEKYEIQAKIKWPNDIYVDDLKICGILVEAVYEQNLKGVIIGIGLNVNSVSGDYASMKMKTGYEYSIKSLMIAVLKYFKIYYSLYQQGAYDKILEYANEIAYLKDKQVDYLNYGKVTFTHLNEDGMISFIDSKKQVHSVLVNEVSLHHKVLERG